MLRDMVTNLTTLHSLLPASRTADTDGTGIDVAKHSAATIAVAVGAPGITFSGTDKIEFVLYESDDNSTFTAVAAADILGTQPVIDANADASKTYLFGYIGNKRYIRVRAEHSGTHGTGTVYGASVILGHPRYGHAEVV